MTNNLLIVVIQVLAIILVILWGIIGISLIYRKKRTRERQNIEEVFAKLTSEYLYPIKKEDDDLIRIIRAFRKAGITPSHKKNVQFLIDLMIRAQRTILGENYTKLENLFKQIPPYGASAEKLKSKKWYRKARGIREAYEMNQGQYIQEILKHRNDKNIYVRREAQIAMVVFLGWDSLRFLPYLKKEMMLWQQIKVVEKLFDLHPVPNLEILRKSYNTQKPYAQKLIMRIIRRFGLDSEVDFIIQFLDHEDFELREVAIYCISSFVPDHERRKRLEEKFFSIENEQQQIQVIKYLERTSLEASLDFFKDVLSKGSDNLQLSAAEILWNHGFKKDIEHYYFGQYQTEPKDTQLQW
ncbi:hypothetical protein [Salinimicrobium soli]|uniref:hypothetical protein n=1 Tax=Salinimicrobium soli TaxID=1254399 RepID=UPI003AADFBDD